MNINKIALLKKWIDESDRIVFFGGAGVSTESGVPDFRSKDGLYNQHDVRFERYSPEYLLSHSCFEDHPDVFYEFYRQKMDTRNVTPNFAHRYLAELENEGKLLGVVTQNIDGLHQRAGSRKVFEIHGSTARNYCERCGKKYDENYIFDSHEKIPRCTCGGRVRCDVTLYEEMLPDEAVENAVKAIGNADMMIIGGTSLRVYPAASFIHYFNGERLVIIDKNEVDVDIPVREKLFIEGKIGEVFSAVKNYKQRDV